MRLRKDARWTATVLDKARELSRQEPAADWSEAEWKTLMAAAVAQRIEGREEREKPGYKAIRWRPALTYGGAALIMMAIIGYALRDSIFRPGAGPSPSTRLIAQKDAVPAAPAPAAERPNVIGGIAKPTEADAAKTRSDMARLDSHAKEEAASKSLADVIQEQKPFPPAGASRRLAAAGETPSQDSVTVRLVSPETGLQIVWVLDKNFEWKGESQ